MIQLMILRILNVWWSGDRKGRPYRSTVTQRDITETVSDRKGRPYRQQAVTKELADNDKKEVKIRAEILKNVKQ